jgi:acrylyl-CoA reductase (NADPH)
VSLKAFRIHEENGRVVARYETLELSDLSAGDVVIRVAWSGINYKDALAATGAGKILRKYPLVGGIDLAGVVEQSSDPRYAPGDRVLVTGCDLSETRDGGYAELARVPGDSVVPIPPGLDERSAMAIGTAGFTAALAIHRMEQNGQVPALGPVVVTGATGGVGSLAIDMLNARGYEVIAFSGKTDAEGYLREIGASQVLQRQSVDYGSRPLERAQFGGAIDNVGGDALAWLTRTVNYGGNIASVGLAGGPRLETTVMPFILRAVNLLGINSVSTPRATRLAVWGRLASDLAPRHLARIVTREIPFDLLASSFQDYVSGRVIGRTVVRVG